MDSVKVPKYAVIAGVTLLAILAICLVFASGQRTSKPAGMLKTAEAGLTAKIDVDYPKTPGEVLRAMVETYGGLDKADGESAKKYLTDNAINGRFVWGRERQGVLSVWRYILEDNKSNRYFYCDIDYSSVTPKDDSSLTKRIEIVGHDTYHKTSGTMGSFVLVYRDGRWQVDGIEG